MKLPIRLAALGLVGIVVGVLFANAFDERSEADGSPFDWDNDLSSPFSMTEEVFGFPGATIPGVESFSFVIPNVANNTAGDITAQVYFSKNSAVAKDGIHLLLSSTRIPITGCTITVRTGFSGQFSGQCSVNAADAATLISLGIVNPSNTTQSIFWGLGPEAKKLTFSAVNSGDKVSLALNPPPPVSCTPASLKFVMNNGGAASLAKTCTIATTPNAQALTVSVATTSGGNWLTATSNPGTSPSTLTVSVNPSGRVPASYTGTVTISIPSGDTAIVPVVFTILPASAQFVQQGGKLVGADDVGGILQGQSVALSADGNSAVVGGFNDLATSGFPPSHPGGAWVFLRSGGLWAQGFPKFVGFPWSGDSQQGISVAQSADGTTTLIGGPNDNNGVGAAWVVRGSCLGKLAGNNAIGLAQQGLSVAISANGGTAIVGGNKDNSGTGAAWVYTCSNGFWTQQAKLVGSGAIGAANQGNAVALSADGNTALVGGPQDNSSAGATWVFTRSGTTWTQQSKLVGSDASGAAHQGTSAALSGDGNTALIGGHTDTNNKIGAAWVFTRSGAAWTQQGTKLSGNDFIGPYAFQGQSVGLSTDGNTAVLGGSGDNNFYGAAWVFKRSGGVWTQLGSKLVGTGVVGNRAGQGVSVAVSGDGGTIMVGGNADNSSVGAAWTFVMSGPAPTISSLNPTQTTAGDSGFSLTINGTNFLNGATVQWNGNTLPTTFASAAQLTAPVPAAFIGITGTASISVTNPDGAPSNSVNLTVTGPALTITKTHTGNLTQGQHGGVYTVTVSDPPGAGPTSGTVTVTEIVPAGLSLVSMSGAGWTCPAGANTCTRSDILASGSSYESITVTVNVAADAPSQTTNQVIVTGVGSPLASASDVTVIGAAPPTVGRLTPSSGSGSSQTFSAPFTKPGAAAFSSAYMLINSSFNGLNSCYVQYLPSGNGLYLLNDAASAWLGPITPGSGATLQNNQCTLNGSGSTVPVVGNTLTLNASLTFKPAFSGSKTIFLFAYVGSLGTGFQTSGAWTVTGAPTAGLLTPASGSGASQTFSAPFTNPSGAAAFTSAYMLISSSFNALNSCYVQYLPSGNGLYLLNDAASAWLGPITPGSGATVQNNQCTLNGTGSSVAAVGNTLTLNAALMFKPAFLGSKTVYLFAYVGSLGTGFQTAGAWTVTAGAPTAGPLAPASGSGASQTFSAPFTNPSGAAAFTSAYMLINSGFNAANGCYLQYLPSGNGLYLLNDAASAWLGPITPGSGATLQNNQCTLNGTGSTVPVVGTTLTLNASLTFKPAFAGSKTVYLFANTTSAGTGFLTAGTWTVTAGAPTAGPLDPASGSGASQTFTAPFTNLSGAAAFTSAYMLINSGFNATNGCYIQYLPAGNGLYLLNDASSAWLGPITPGGGAILQNNQCTLNGSGSRVTSIGNVLTVNSALSFKPEFAGSKTVYLFANTASAGTGFQTAGAWTVTAGAPTAGPLSPASGSGTSQTLSAPFSNPSGAAMFTSAYMLINFGFAATNGCYIQYLPSGNGLYLLNDAASAWLGPITPGSAATLQNNQCILNGTGSSVTSVGNTLTLNSSLTFKPTFAGAKTVFIFAYTAAGNTGFQIGGAWTSQ